MNIDEAQALVAKSKARWISDEKATEMANKIFERIGTLASAGFESAFIRPSNFFLVDKQSKPESYLPATYHPDWLSTNQDFWHMVREKIAAKGFQIKLDMENTITLDFTVGWL